MMRDSVTMLVLFALLTLAGSSASGQQVPAASPDMVTADSLIALYLRLENALWQVVRSTSADTADKVKRIHETHLTLLETDFREKGMPLDRLDADQAQLYNAMAYINMSQRSVLDGHLHENARDRTRDNALTFARHGVNMSQTLERIFNVTETVDFYNYIARRGQLQSCELGGVSTVQSPHQMLYDYYHDIAVAQLKAYALAQLANMFVTVYDVQRIAVGAADQLRRVYLQRSARGQERVRRLMGEASREVWVCDPDDASRMEHAAEVTRLLQGYVDNEVNLNEVNDCKKTCADYPSARNYQCFNGSHCADNQEVLPQAALRCAGAVVGCEFVSADMEICHSNDPTRRYDSIKYTCGKKMGEQPDACTTLKTQATSWTRWLVQCSQCFCYCDEPGPHSDRYFSLQPVVSDITKNMVITGVAIRKINRIFYWQIIERPLIANGEVSQSAAHAVPTDGEFALRRTFRLTDPNVVDGTDYHTLNHANRSVNLDVLQVPAGFVCTGVRFAVEQGSLKVSIRGTRYNFKSGQLSLRPEDSEWLANTIYERKQIVPVEGLPVPTRSLSKSVPDVRPNHFVEFGPSDKWTDVAQRTVPFVDTQTVRPQVFVPLAGVGLYYKGVPNFGGYVAPKLVTFDYMNYVKNL